MTVFCLGKKKIVAVKRHESGDILGVFEGFDTQTRSAIINTELPNVSMSIQRHSWKHTNTHTHP